MYHRARENILSKLQPECYASGLMKDEITCPMCSMTDVLAAAERYECVTCGQEWEREAEPESVAGPRVVKDAHGNVLADGDQVILIKDLKLGGGNQVLKGGSKSKSIRLVEGDHEISCKMDGIAVELKACFVKKA